MDMKPLFSSQCLLEFVFLVRGYGSALRQRGLGYEALEIESARNRSVLMGFDGFHLANPVGLIFGKTGGLSLPRSLTVASQQGLGRIVQVSH